MKDRFPRTPAEFRENDRIVVGHCTCGHSTRIKSENLIQRFGPDFDLYDGLSELRRTLTCEVCDHADLRLVFQNLGRRRFDPVSFEDSLTSSLELRAFAAARDAGLPDGLKALSPLRGSWHRKFRHHR